MATLKLLPPSFSAWQERAGQKSIFLLMSGGVDSSVTAHLLKEDGWNILGVTMKVPVAEKCGLASPCCGADAALVAQQLDLCHYYLDSLDLFAEKIIAPFKLDYAQGRTPNPCLNCNSLLKFTAVWDFLRATFGNYPVATGHYARIVKREQPSETRMVRARETKKDQSYFLYGIPREDLAQVYFPLGEMKSKADTRAIARKIGISVAEKKDSMELCFAGEDDYRQALNPAGQVEGAILNDRGEEVGRHQGIQNFTLGQRRGVGVATGVPAYVLKILPAENTVVIGPREAAMTRRVTAGLLNKLVPESLVAGANIFACIRSGSKPRACQIIVCGANSVEVEFAEAVFAPTPGQHLVLYDAENAVLCGGTIEPAKVAQTTPDTRG